MANTPRVSGFNPVKYTSGAPYNGAANVYAVPTSDTTASYAIGDVVMSAGSSDSNGVPYIKKIPAANASNFIALGVVVGILPVNAGPSLQGVDLDLSQIYLPAGTRTTVQYLAIADDPQLLFEVSGGVTATNLTQAKARYNAGIVSIYSGADQTYAINQNATVTNLLSPSAPLSNIAIGSATVNTTNTLPVQLLGLAQNQDNTFGAYCTFLCRFNNHEFGNATGTNWTAL
jgi:hypothetical protein